MPSNFKKLIAVSSFFTKTDKEAKGISNWISWLKCTLRTNFSEAIRFRISRSIAKSEIQISKSKSRFPNRTQPETELGIRFQ